MNTEMQKKWFIYVQDHHEGPFSVDEVFQKQKGNVVSTESYVWCEGMADWQTITEVPDLHRDLKNKSQAEEMSNKVVASVNVANIVSSTNSEINSKKSIKYATASASNSKMGLKVGVLIGTALLLLAITFGALSVLSRTASDDLHAKLRPTFAQILDRFPFAASFIKATPPLTDVKAEDVAELETAIVGSPDAAVKIGIALSYQDANRPFFYLSSNLPDGTKLDVNLVGNGETLLNKLQFFTQSNATLHAGFAKTDVILGDGGQAIPKGEYRVYVSESNDQDENVKNALNNFAPVKIQTNLGQVPEGTKFLFSKVYFLGGERDQIYLTRLKAFHEKVKESAQKELEELKQYTDTLSNQFSAVSNQFASIYHSKKVTPTLKGIWKKNFASWKQLSDQLDLTMQTWSKETLQNDFFYGKVYDLVRGTNESLKRLFDLENSFIEKPTDKASFDIQQGKAFSEARDSVELLQTKMKLMLNSPKTPSGLPTREGL